MASILTITGEAEPSTFSSQVVDYLTTHPWQAIGLIALANFGTGHVGLGLAAQSPFATAVFPPAGIALWAVMTFGARIWPGILCGSVMLNLSIANETLATDTLLIALSIAAGSCLQALVGARLIRRLGYQGPAPSTARDTWVLLFAGCASCLIAASWGTLTLTSSGAIASNATYLNLLSWWVGDALGIIVFTPILLLLADKHNGRRLGQVAIPLMGAMLAVLIALKLTTEAEENRFRLQFERAAANVASGLSTHIARHMEVLKSIQAFYISSTYVSRDEFRSFVTGALKDDHAIQALEWIPRIPDDARAQMEAAARSDGSRLGVDALQKFRFTEHDDRGNLITAAKRTDYYPVYYIEPVTGNENALGFDLSSHPQRRAALQRSAQHNSPVASKAIELIQGGQGVLVFAPIRKAKDANRADNALLGFALGVFKIEQLVEQATRIRRDLGLQLTLKDVTESGIGDVMFADTPLANRAISTPRFTTRYSFETDMADRHWRVDITPSDRFHAQHRNPLLWMILPGGLLFVLLTSAFTLIMTGRLSEIGALVEERTEELGQSNRDLAASASQLARQNEELLRTNDDLDKFAHVASHDLRAPLRGIAQLATWIKKDVGDSLSAKSTEHLGLLQGRVRRMELLLEGLLEYSRAGRGDITNVDIQTLLLVRDAIELSNLPEGITTRVYAPMPTIHGKKPPLLQVFQNLISNAAKHHDREKGLIEIRARPLGDGLIEFSVCDDGPGIPAKYRERVFEMFQTLRSRDELEASGMGLAIVRKVVERNGGAIQIDGNTGRGTCMRFTWPAYALQTAGD